MLPRGLQNPRVRGPAREFKRKVNGKTVREPIPDEYTLAASGAKEVGAAAVRALMNPNTHAGRQVRGLPADATAVNDPMSGSELDESAA
jgi:hypothetical protein